MKIGIVILATNAYFILGIRFIKKFMKYYKGDNKITFYFFSDTDPSEYVQDIDIRYIETKHSNWVEGTNSKFSNIISLENEEVDYLYYFDADTNIDKDFKDTWLLGDMVGGEHYGNRTFMQKTGYPFDRNSHSRAYIPKHTPLPQMYYYGAFFGGKKEKVLYFCKILQNNQLADRKIHYEPAVNDESYINQYFHYNPPTRTVLVDEFPFLVSDKGGLGETRNVKLDTEQKKAIILKLKDIDFDIRNNEIIYEKDLSL